MPVPADPPVAVTPSAFRTWALDVSDTVQAHETKLADGDKGDISVAGSSWTIDSSAVTIAKINATGTPSASTYLRGDGSWSTPAGGGSTVQLLHVRDEKASGTGGGTSTSGSWQTRTLNTSVTNEVTGASLAANEITLPAGTYEVDARSPIYKGGFHKARLYNVTAAAAAVQGSSEFVGAAVEGQSDSVVRGRFTLAVTSKVRLEYRVFQGQTTSGLGAPASFGDVEVYADVMIRKIS